MTGQQGRILKAISGQQPAGERITEGWMMKGPNYSQDFLGWAIYASKEHPEMIPVTIVHAPTEGTT